MYGVFTDFLTFPPWIIVMLTCLVVTAELGGRALRFYLTRNYPVSRDFSINSVFSHFAGMLASDALLGPVLGLVAWELIAGKTLLPRSDTVLRMLLRLAGVAVLRFACGLIMIVLINMYIL
ncbi:MAG: hypothetical protein K0R55_3186 [Sporomusa sp.]|nr:hypothetical protein [Sporomusa sp.]